MANITMRACTTVLVLVAAVVVSATSAADISVHEDAELTKPLQPGSAVPSACVKTVSGEPIDLASQLRENGALLVFYRGGW